MKVGQYMDQKRHSERLGLEVWLQHPDHQDRLQVSGTRDDLGNIVYPELDADGAHIHFEMVPMQGDSLMWLTIRRGTTPELAVASLRKIADLIERHGTTMLNLPEGNEGAVDAEGGLIPGPLRLSYDENGDLCLPNEAART
jgi:hypothetical protein